MELILINLSLSISSDVLLSLHKTKGDITDLAVSSNNALVASASNDYSIRVVSSIS